MNNCLTTILITVILGFGSTVFAGVSANVTTEVIDGFYVSTITLNSDIGVISAIDFNAEGNLVDHDLVTPFGTFDTLYNEPPLSFIEGGIDTRLLFLQTDVLDLRDYKTDTNEKLASVFGGFNPFTQKDVAMVVSQDDAPPVWLPLYDLETSSYILDIYVVSNGELYRLFEDTPVQWPAMCQERARYGDFSCDALTDLVDLTILGEHYNQPGDFNEGDTNADGMVDLLDLTSLGEIKSLDICEYADQGDFDCDGHVDLLDLMTLNDHYKTAVPKYMFGDVDGSGFVDLIDADILFGNYNTHYDVPEPGALGLIGLGGLLAVFRRR